MPDIYFILAGLLVGFCVGVTGVGGGSLMTPILISVMGVPANVAIGTDLLYASISKFCGSLVHAKKLNIVWPIVLWLAIGSIPASLGTTWALHHFFSSANEYKKLLTMVLGFMLVLTGVSIVFRAQIERFFARKRHDSSERSQDEHATALLKNKPLVVFMGAVLGIFVTLSSVGAGAFGVMALVLLFPNLPMIRVIGSDVAHAVLLTLVAGLGHLVSGNVDFHMLTMLLIGAIPAIIIGTLISSRLPEHHIRRILGITLLLLGVNFIINPTKAKAPASVAPAAVISNNKVQITPSVS
ncbi:sulfite exporter TauE/SafE family protein [Aquirhabdus parva]|uniref:Probable membrane transporter protein n=1 Tax=Aquirhabdus parva TaxID=2283318 RepID=A0A345P575_9GAMM|nr:sulfite exporter TauE/SafE family protein [Aquirhabdus parva]AXI02434.1 sulfite exporter TauE/SafE family protein [Aquirhabdus parva]